MKSKLTILMGFLLAMLISTSAYAVGGEGRGHGGCSMACFSDGEGKGWKDGNGMPGFKKLNLTAEQKAKLDILRGECKKETQPLREQMMVKRTELRALWLENNPDAEKIKAAQKDMNLLRDQMMDKITTYRLSTLALLTAEQKAELQKFHKEKGSGKHKQDKVKNLNKIKVNDNK